MKLGIEKSLRRSKSNLKEAKKPEKSEKPVIGKFLNNELNLSNIKSVKTINSDDHLSQKIKNLLKDSNSGSKDSTKIENIPTITAKKNEDFQKKITMPPSFAQNKAQQDSDEDQMFMEFSAQKIKQLEQKLSTKNKENQDNLLRIQDLESENSSVI